MGKPSQHRTVADVLGAGWSLDRQGYVLCEGKAVGQLKRRGHTGHPLYSWTLFPVDGRQGDSGSGYTDRNRALLHLHRSWVRSVRSRR
jgi:hypothetical protein